MDDELINISELTLIESNYYKELVNFYEDYCNDKNNLMDEIINIINSKNKLSLRFVDWVVSKYCKLYSVSIVVNNKYNKEDSYNIFIGYNAHVDTHDKYYFDPFKRRKKCQKFLFEIGKYKFITNICQLIYFKWIIQYDILIYVKNNSEFLNGKIKEVNEIFKKIKEEKKKKKIMALKCNTDCSSHTTSTSFSLEI